MNLTARTAVAEDLAACVHLLENHRAYAPELVFELPGIWRRLLREEAIIFAVFEDSDRPLGTHIVGFGASVFLSDAFMREAGLGTEPYLTARVIQAELAGATPILRLAAIRTANAGMGLNTLILHYAETPTGYDATERYLIAHKSLESFLWQHRGYQVKEVLQEISDEIGLPYKTHSWGLLRSDYANYFEHRGIAAPAPEERPYLFGITREEALVMPGCGMASVFAYKPPRFFFSRSERHLLERALLGETDAELACSLKLALPTVKSQWRSIYGRIGCVDSQLAGLLSLETERRASRGLERRRHILEYLRQHREELRPCARARTYARNQAA